MTPLKPTLTDRFLASVAPSYAVRRYQARLAFYSTGQYAGARSDRAATKSWKTHAGSADTDSLGDLPTLRSRSRDLTRNNPISAGALKTSRSNVIGTGLTMRANVDRKLLGLSEEAAQEWEQHAEALFDLFARSKLADITRQQTFYELQTLVFGAVFESGDVLVTRRRPKVGRPVVPLALGIVEADRIETPPEEVGRPDIRMGVKLDEDGAPLSYFVLNDHPGEAVLPAVGAYKEIPAWGERSGERMVLHVFRRLRPGQTRGIPELAPVIETLKQLDRFTEAELMKAVVSSFFTVFMRTDGDDGLAGAAFAGAGPGEVALGAGTVVDIGKDESIDLAQSSINSNFDPFFNAIVRQIGVALSIPYELLVMHFTASYSASRAALEMASQFFKETREWLAVNFCQPVYEWFLSDAINAGLIQAPGFYEDPVRRAAWLGSQWIGPARMMLDPLKEWKAEEVAVNMGARTLEQVITEKTGEDWETTTEQRGREHALRAKLKLEPEVLAVIQGDTSQEEVDPANETPDVGDSEAPGSGSGGGNSGGKGSGTGKAPREPRTTTPDGKRRDKTGKFT